MSLRALLVLACVAVAGCAFHYDSRSGARYSVAFIPTGKHEVDRVAMDAESRAAAECYVHGTWHASALVPVWTDEAWHPEGEDGLSFPHPQCAREDEFLSDLDDAIHGAGLTATDLAGVSIVQVTGKPSCKSEAGVYASYPACEQGYVVEIARGLSRPDRQAALDASFRALLQARLVAGAWGAWGLGEPSGPYTAEAWRDRMAEYERLPNWNAIAVETSSINGLLEYP